MFVNRDLHLPFNVNDPQRRRPDLGYTPVTFAGRVYLGDGRVMENGRPYAPSRGGAFDEQLWSDNRVFGGLLFDTPTRIRPLRPDGQVDLLTPARSPAFLGVVQENEVRLPRLSWTQFVYSHPRLSGPLTSVDQFIRTIPSMAGGQNYVRVRSVDLVRYYLEPEPDAVSNRSARLLRVSAKANGGTPFVVATNVESVEFERSSVTQKVIKFAITKFKR